MGVYDPPAPHERTAEQKKPRMTAAERTANRRKGGWRTAPKRNRFGELTQAGEKALIHETHNEVKAEVRAMIWIRSEDRCECCGFTERQTAEISHIARHQMHHIVKLSQTKGLPPRERTNVRICMRACKPCHDLLEAHQREVMWKDDEKAMQGDYDIVDANGKVLREVRRNIR